MIWTQVRKFLKGIMIIGLIGGLFVSLGAMVENYPVPLLGMVIIIMCWFIGYAYEDLL